MKLKILLTALMISIAFVSCSQKHKRSGSLLTPVSSGNPYEVMVVADDSVYQGYAGRAVQRILDFPLIGLPQQEEQFHKSHITEKHFDKVTNIFRNIIRIKIDPKEYTMPKMTVEKDVHSVPQIIITIQGADQMSVSQYITEHTKQISSAITADEINRQANDLVNNYNKNFYDAVKEMFGCEMYIPTDIKEMKIGNDFIWASDNGLSSIQNICIYSLPYVSEKMFTKGPFIALRNKVMKENIPGGHPGQYMSTNSEFVYTKMITVNGNPAFEARGLWEMEGDDMGGPFVSHSRLDTVNNRVIIVEGFVYAPDKMKRTMIRRMEGALYTLKF